MEEQVLETIQKYNLINSGDSIVVGVSGGPDSMCLLNLLINLQTKLNIKIVVAHINHMIREEADSETEYVYDFCKKNDIQCFIKKANVVEIAKQLKLGTEETGRNIRYEFFEEVLQQTNSNKIATAHNANDNAETVLMNIIRGAGTSGLKGIDPIRDNKFIRPIIECERKDIERYCNENNLNPKYDESNKENIYTRNKIRNLLIPYLEKEFNPNIILTINRMSQLAKSENEYFDSVTKKSYEDILISENSNEIVVNLKKFNELELVIKNRLVLFMINKILGNTQGIEKVNIDDIVKLCSNNIGNKFLKPNKNIKIYVKSGKIFLNGED